MKTYIYRSTFKEGLTDFFRKQLLQEHYAVLDMMFNGYNVERMLWSSFFEIFRASDGRYTLEVQKYVNDTFSVKFTIDMNYAIKLDRFCGYGKTK